MRPAAPVTRMRVPTRAPYREAAEASAAAASRDGATRRNGAPQRTSGMKWWGWGRDDVVFTHQDKPELGPFLARHLAIDVTRVSTQPRAFDDLDIPAPRLPGALRAALEDAVGPQHVSADAHDRLVHARGKSLRDLVRHRSGDLGRLPDLVLRPGAEDEVVAILEAALAADAVVIPF